LTAKNKNITTLQIPAKVKDAINLSIFNLSFFAHNDTSKKEERIKFYKPEIIKNIF